MTGLIGKVLPGVAAMANIHPLLVHFPIAFLNGFLLMEFLGVLLKKEEFRTAATWMLYLGTLGAVAAVLAGLQASAAVSHAEEVHEIMLRHRSLGITVLALGVFLSAWRLIVRGRFSFMAQLVHLAVAFVTVGVMTFGADLGGLMVYKYGVGGKAVEQPAGHVHGRDTAADAREEGAESAGMERHGDGHDREGSEPHGH